MEIVVVILLVCSYAVTPSAAPDQPAAQPSENNWLHPGDSSYQRAIQEGFGGTAKIGPYNEDKGGIHQVWLNFTTSRPGRNAIVFSTPLRCAQLVGIGARQNLLDLPGTDDTRKICDGKLFVSITYSSRNRAESFPIAITHEDVTVHPASVDFAESPDVSVYRSGASYIDYTYTYVGNFYFSLPAPWTSDIKLRYVVPENGDPVRTDVDFSIFARDEVAYR